MGYVWWTCIWPSLITTWSQVWNFPQWSHVCIQKLSDFRTFWTSDIWIRDTQPVWCYCLGNLSEHVHMHPHTSTHTHTHACPSTHIHAQTHVWAHTYMHTHMLEHTCTCTHICLSTHRHAHAHMCMLEHIHTHTCSSTHTHTVTCSGKWHPADWWTLKNLFPFCLAEAGSLL